MMHEAFSHIEAPCNSEDPPLREVASGQGAADERLLVANNVRPWLRRFFRDKWAIARNLYERVYCNPFEQRRWELERSCLGEDYQEGLSDIAPNLPRGRR